MEEPDPQVIAAARRGDTHAFEELVRLFQGHVWRFCFGFVRERAAADDVTQEAFVKAFRSIHAFKGDSKFSTWLFSIARNCATDELRKGQRRRRLFDRAIRERIPMSKSLETTADLRAIIGELPHDLREVVVLIDMLGFRYKEAAQICGVAVGTIKSRLHFARASIVQTIAEGEASDEA